MHDGKAVAAYFTYFGSLLLFKLSDGNKNFAITVESTFHNAHCLVLIHQYIMAQSRYAVCFDTGFHFQFTGKQVKFLNQLGQGKTF